MSYETFIALRYLRSKRRKGFFSVITYISILGVTIGVAALIIVLSVMNGFESEVRSRFIGVDAHIKVRAFFNKGISDIDAMVDKIKDLKHIEAISPYIYEKGLILSEKETTGLLIRGIDEETAGQVTNLEESITYGVLNLKGKTNEHGRTMPGILIGFNLADQLQETIGDTVQVWSFTNVRRVGQLPNMRQFIVTGYYESGLFEVDNTTAYISIDAAQRLFQMSGKVTGLGIKLDNYLHADAVAKQIDDLIGYPYRVLTWFDLNENFFAWVKIEKWAAFLILCLIIMVAAFNIVSTMIMVTMEKTREIGILKSIGATSKSIRRIFTYEGLFVGIIGTFLGVVIGYGVCWSQWKFRYLALPNDVYVINWLPVSMQWTDFFAISTAAILITYVASVYPAARAAKQDPVESIRNE